MVSSTSTGGPPNLGVPQGESESTTPSGSPPKPSPIQFQESPNINYSTRKELREKLEIQERESPEGIPIRDLQELLDVKQELEREARAQSDLRRQVLVRASSDGAELETDSLNLFMMPPGSPINRPPLPRPLFAKKSTENFISVPVDDPYITNNKLQDDAYITVAEETFQNGFNLKDGSVIGDHRTELDSLELPTVEGAESSLQYGRIGKETSVFNPRTPIRGLKVNELTPIQRNRRSPQPWSNEKQSIGTTPAAYAWMQQEMTDLRRSYFQTLGQDAGNRRSFSSEKNFTVVEDAILAIPNREGTSSRLEIRASENLNAAMYKIRTTPNPLGKNVAKETLFSSTSLSTSKVLDGTQSQKFLTPIKKELEPSPSSSRSFGDQKIVDAVTISKDLEARMREERMRSRIPMSFDTPRSLGRLKMSTWDDRLRNSPSSDGINTPTRTRKNLTSGRNLDIRRERNSSKSSGIGEFGKKLKQTK